MGWSPMRAIAVAVLAAAALCGQSGLPPEVVLLSRIRRAAIDNLDRMPNYVCMETIERSTRPSGRRYSISDYVALDVAHLEGTELYAWPGDDSFQKKEPSDFVGFGASSTGEYAGHLRTIFLSRATTIKYAGDERVNGARAARYDFAIPEFAARMKLRIGNTSGTSGIRGSIWADPQTLDVVRLELHADGIPPDVDLQSGSTRVEYKRVTIGKREVVLPARSEVRLINLAGFEWRNVTTFAGCREYVGKSTITFGEEADSARRRIEPSPPAVVPLELQPGIEIQAALTEKIDLDRTPVGVPVRAQVVRQAGEIPEGAIMTGRIREVRRWPNRSGANVIFEFIRIDYVKTRGAINTFVSVYVRQRTLRRGFRIIWRPHLPATAPPN